MKTPTSPQLCSRGCGRKLASYNKSGVCAVCTNTPKSYALKEAAGDLLAEVGPCVIERGHHVNNLGARRQCAACELRRLVDG